MSIVDTRLLTDIIELTSSFGDGKEATTEAKTPMSGHASHEIDKKVSQAVLLSPALLMQSRLMRLKRMANSLVWQKDWIEQTEKSKTYLVSALQHSERPTETVAYYKIDFTSTHMRPAKIHETQQSVTDFKITDQGAEPICMMERLMWDIAVVMGVEKHFAATGSFEAFIKSQVTEPKETEYQDKVISDSELGTNAPETKIQSAEGASIKALAEKRMQWKTLPGRGIELKPVKVETISKGNIQIKALGVNLRTFMLDPRSRMMSGKLVAISKAPCIQATLVTLIFGMFDAHARNIMVNKKGNFRFFDNAQSLPHSNGVILWGDNLRSSYRSGLLALPQSYQNLNESERTLIKTELVNAKFHMEKLKVYLSHPTTKSRLRLLPPCCFDSELVIDAMAQRIDNMEKSLSEEALKTSGALCLRDLVFAAHPQFKFIAALTLLGRRGELLENKKEFSKEEAEEVQQALFQEVGYYFVDDLLTLCAGKKKTVWDAKKRANREIRIGFDLDHLAKLCETTDFTSLVNELAALYKATVATPPSNDQLDAYQSSIDVHLKHLKSIARVDLKDRQRKA